MKKTYLLTPGPTPIPESVLSVFAQPIIHHRTPEFKTLFQEVRTGLQRIFQTRQDVLLLACTGTGSMEATVSNLFSTGETVITINAGKFGERWGKIARAYGLKVAEFTLPPGQAASPQRVDEWVKKHPDAKAILFQASETSTGVRMPVQEITSIAQKAGMLSVCDAITACGVFDLPMDDWGIDVLITGSQKAFMLPPGLAFLAFSERAWAANSRSNLPKFYFNLSKEKEAQAKNQTAWTPATSLIQGLRESLRIIEEEGIQNVFKRHELLAHATRVGVKALGLEILSPEAPSPAVTAVVVPKSIPDGKMIPKLMREKHGVTIAGGQDELEGKIFRLSHFGYCGKFDIVTAISCLELTLAELGMNIEFGKGVGAVLQVFAQNETQTTQEKS